MGVTELRRLRQLEEENQRLKRLGDKLNDQQHQELTGLTQEWLTIVDGKAWSFKQREFIC